jgi:hypothetical protein
MSKKWAEKRFKEILSGKFKIDPRDKKGIGEIYPWSPSESSKLLPLKAKKSKKIKK